MFKRFMIAVCAMTAITVAKADEGQKVASKVQKVTVFLKGAQVTRTAAVNINAGTTDLIFNNISPNIDPQSIQVHANGEFTILSVKHEMNYLSSASNKTQQLSDLHAKQKSINDKITMLNNMLAIYQAEETVIAKYQSVKAEIATLVVLKLKQNIERCIFSLD